MNRAFVVLLVVFTAVVTLAVAAAADTATDRAAVERAALDYVEGIYDVRPEFIKRSVHPTLAKRGFHKRDGAYVESQMTFDQLVNLAATWNREGKRDTSVKRVKVLEVMDKTAIAQVFASWGVDHMLLAKYGDTWQIVQILWQSPPPAGR